MLVEMLTGKHPASADPTPEGVARQVEARNPSGMRPEVLGELTRVVGRLMRRDPGQRYQTATDVVSDLHAVREQLSGARPYRAASASTRSRLALGAGAIVILIGTALGVLRWTRSSDDPRPSRVSRGARISLAVLPLKNYATPDQEYFADGMTDELIATLMKIEALQVIAHQSVLQFKQSTRPAPEIARILNVKYLVDGSLREDSTHVKITASLVDAASNTPVWSDSFERDRRDVMALQRDVALAIARAIQVRLTPQDQTRLAPVHEPKPEALTNYIRGAQARYDANITGEFDKAIPYLKAAIEKDSDFAAPYAGLASVYATMNDETRARALVDKALALDPKLAEAHVVRGTLFETFHWKLSEAERAYREAIANNPGFAEAHHELSMLLIRLRRFDEALQEGRQAVLYNPTSLRFINGVAEVQIYSGDETAVLATADSLLAKDSTYANAYQLKGFAYEVLEKWGDALNAWTECLRVTPTGCEYGRAHIGYIYGRSGRRDEARRILDTLLARVSAQDRARSQGALAWDIATVYLGIGDRAQALTWLERATDAHEGYMLYLAADPTYKPLRGARRFEALLKKLGLPSAT
jgi:TolB-like protein/Flp pilus assembly protein TadD